MVTRGGVTMNNLLAEIASFTKSHLKRQEERFNKNGFFDTDTRKNLNADNHQVKK